MKETYLGNGVYTTYDGKDVCLHANNQLLREVDHKLPTDNISLEPDMLTKLNVFAKRCVVNPKLICNDERKVA